MTDDKRLDPRYDPAFQRGFDGSVTSGSRTRTQVRRPALVVPAPYRSPDPEQAQAPVVGDGPIEDARPTLSGAVDDPAAAPDVGVAPASMIRELTRNPFLVSLVVLGIAMTVVGIAWANQARQLVASRGGAGTELDYWFLQASVTGAPLTILAGIGVLAGVLFIAATAWNRRGPVDRQR